MGKYKEPNISLDSLNKYIEEHSTRNVNMKKYLGYYVCQNGDIYNKHGHKMTPYKNKNGIWVIMLRDRSGKRICPTVDRFIYQAFNQHTSLKNKIVRSSLNHDYEINNGTSNKPIFNVYDNYLVDILPGGIHTKDYRDSHIRLKQDIINKRNELMRDSVNNKRDIQILNWVLDRDLHWKK